MAAPVAAASIIAAKKAVDGFKASIDNALGSVKSLGAGITLAFAGAAIGVDKINSSVQRLGDGLEQLLRFRANQDIRGIANTISDASNGLINFNKSLEIGRFAKQLGLSAKRMNSMSQSATILSRTFGVSAEDVIMSNLRAIASSNINTAKFNIKNFGEINDLLNVKNNSHSVSNALLEKEQALIKQNKNQFNSSAVTLLSNIKKIKDKVSGLGDIFGGLAGIIKGVLAPAMAGLAGFFINPITGIFGLGAGLGLSGILGAGLVGAIGGLDLTGDRKSNRAEITRVLDSITDALIAMLDVFLKGIVGVKKGTVELGEEARKTLENISGLKAEDVLQQVGAFGASIGKFSRDFLEDLKTNAPLIKQELNNIIEYIRNFINTLTGESNNNKLAKNLIEVKTAIGGFIDVLVPLGNALKKISEVVKGISDSIKGISTSDSNNVMEFFKSLIPNIPIMGGPSSPSGQIIQPVRQKTAKVSGLPQQVAGKRVKSEADIIKESLTDYMAIRGQEESQGNAAIIEALNNQTAALQAALQRLEVQSEYKLRLE